MEHEAHSVLGVTSMRKPAPVLFSKSLLMALERTHKSSLNCSFQTLSFCRNLHLHIQTLVSSIGEKFPKIPFFGRLFWGPRGDSGFSISTKGNQLWASVEYSENIP